MTDNEASAAAVSGDLADIELLQAVREYLKADVAARSSGPARFNALIAANVLSTLERTALFKQQLSTLDQYATQRWGEHGSADAIDRVIASRLAGGSLPVDDELLDYLRQRQLLICAINNPRYASLGVAQQRWASTTAALESC